MKKYWKALPLCLFILSLAFISCSSSSSDDAGDSLCTATDIIYCGDEDSCTTAGGEWHDNSCYNCNSENLWHCQTETSCLANGGDWVGVREMCWEIQPDNNCAIYNLDGCGSEDSCVGAAAWSKA